MVRPTRIHESNCADESGAPGQLQEQSHGQDTEEYAGATETERGIKGHAEIHVI